MLLPKLWVNLKHKALCKRYIAINLTNQKNGTAFD